MDGRLSVVTTVRVRFNEIDAAGIAFYPNFFAWFDLSAHELFRLAMGDRVRDEQGRPRWPFPIVESGASFFAPLLFDDEIAISSSIAELGTTSLRVEHEIARAGQAIASGFERRVHIRYSGGTIAAAPIPDELRRAVDAAAEAARPGTQ